MDGLTKSEAFKVGDRVTCAPAGIAGVVYAIAPGVVYVKLARGEVIDHQSGGDAGFCWRTVRQMPSPSRKVSRTLWSDS
jgi:hypothetical protein